MKNIIEDSKLPIIDARFLNKFIFDNKREPRPECVRVRSIYQDQAGLISSKKSNKKKEGKICHFA